MNPISSVIIHVITGSGAPSNAVGVNGQSYYDLNNGIMYGPKAGGVWPAGVRLKDALYIQSRLQNMITNGSGLLGTNENFSTLSFDATETHGGGGSFIQSGIGTWFSDEYIPVVPEKYYRLDVWSKSGDTDGSDDDTANRQYTGVIQYDIDKLYMAPNYFMKFTGATDTTLAAALNPGDTTITLTDSTGWAVSNVNVYNRQMLWYGYTNAKGYTYPNYTYSRNSTYDITSPAYKTAGLWADGGISGNVITLTAPWPGPAIPAGTAVRNSSSGGSYKYFVLANIQIPNIWTKYSGSIGSLDTPGLNTNNKFTFGCAYIRLLFSQFATAGAKIRHSDIWFSEMSTRNLESASATVPGVVDLAKQQMGAGDKYFVGKVGVNNTNPIRRLDVIDNAEPQIRIGYSSTVYKEEKVDANGDVTVFQSTGDETFYAGLSSTQQRTIFSLQRTMPVATDAGRTGRVLISVSDYAASREVFQADADGTKATVKIPCAMQIGNIAGGNYTEIEADGTVKFVGTATVFEDLNFDPDSGGGAAVTLPDFVTVNNVIHREFTSANNQLCGSVKELPHAYKLSSTLFPHLHLFLKSGESAGTTGVTFTIYWELRQSTGVTSGSVPLSATSAELTANPNKWTVNDNTGFAGSAELGGQLALTLARTGGDAGDVIVTTYGIHFEIDTFGSRQITTK